MGCVYTSALHILASLPRRLVDKAPSYRLVMSGFETGKAHAAWSVLFDSASWHLVVEGHARPRGTMSLSYCGTLIFDPTKSGEPSEEEVIEWWVRGAWQQVLLSGNPGLLPPIQPFG